MGFKINYRTFKRGLAEAMPTTRKDAATFFKAQGGPLAQNLIRMTPPSRGNPRTASSQRALDAGRRTIETDVNKLFTASKKRRLQPVNVPQVVDRHRNRSTGRVRGTGVKLEVRQRDITREIKRRQAKIGILANGWVAAAMEAGVPTSRIWAWVRRHNTPGYGRITADSRKLRLKFANRAKFAGRVAGIQRRVQLALDIQGNSMMRAAAEYWRKKADRHFKTS